MAKIIIVNNEVIKMCCSNCSIHDNNGYCNELNKILTPVKVSIEPNGYCEKWVASKSGDLNKEGVVAPNILMIHNEVVEKSCDNCTIKSKESNCDIFKSWKKDYINSDYCKYWKFKGDNK